MDGTHESDEELEGAVLRGALIGALAGALLSVLDFAATVGLVRTGVERADLALRLLSIAAPVGGAVGAILAGVDVVGRGLIRRRALSKSRDVETWLRRYSPLPLTLALCPLFAVVAWLLFSGAAAAQLALRPLLVACAFAAAAIGTWVVLRLVFAARRWADRGWRRTLIALLALGGAGALTRADQHLYPALYDYLHACLTAASYGCACLAIDVLIGLRPRAGNPALRDCVALPLSRRRARTGLALCFALGLAFVLDLSTLGMSPTVRPTLLDPRASHARSAMLGIAPLLSPSDRAPEDAVARARSARARRRAAMSREDLPTWDGAHVLLVTIDALRPDHLGLEGHTRPTSPVIDRFAEDAVVFERAYAQAPHSSYSLSSAMTSEYLHEVVEAGGTLPEPTLASALADAGYRTSALFPLGIFHTEGERLTRYAESRFDFEHTDVRDLDAAAKTDAAIEELREIARAGEPKSFTWVHYFDVHEPYQDTRFGETDVERYDSEIARVDGELERLFVAADELLAGEVVIALSADHGEEFREHGGVYHGFTLYEEQIRVPLILRAPGLEARRIPAPVELVDLAPTLLGMLGVPTPSSMRGDDLRALSLGKVNEVGPAFAGVGPRRMVVRYPDKLITNFRYGVFRLFDLESDPRELDNRAGRDDARLDELKGEIFAWLDALAQPPDADEIDDPRVLALSRGRLGDRRAVEPLMALLADVDEESLARAEAARLLGVLGDGAAKNVLAQAALIDGADVRDESAIALGRLYDERAAQPLVALLDRTDVATVRARAAIALGRLGDERALAALPDAARDAPSRRGQNEAIRHLGELGGPEQLEPLLALLPDFRTRRPAALALGRLGDPRALPPLLSLLDTEGHANIREAVVRALGRLADPGAIDRLVSLFADEPTLASTAESLVRLDAISHGMIGGTDIGPQAQNLVGWSECEAGDLDHSYEYLSRTHCTANGQGSTALLATPETIREAVDGAELVIRLARADGTDAMEVTLTVDTEVVGVLEVDGGWTEERLRLPPELSRQEVLLRIDAPHPVRVDHALLVARSATLAHSTVR